MKATELKSWMKKQKKTTADVASSLGVSTRTVERFLSGDTTPMPVILAAIERLVAPGSQS